MSPELDSMRFSVALVTGLSSQCHGSELLRQGCNKDGICVAARFAAKSRNVRALGLVLANIKTFPQPYGNRLSLDSLACEIP